MSIQDYHDYSARLCRGHHFHLLPGQLPAG